MVDDLCLWCGRFTTRRAPDGLADCDRPDCLARREYEDEFDLGSLLGSGDNVTLHRKDRS